MITDEQLGDLYFKVLGVRLAEFDALPVHAFMRALEAIVRADEREKCARLADSDESADAIRARSST